MDNLAFISRYEAILREQQTPKRALYEACGISDAAVSQWRKGKTAPSMKSIERIAEFLGVTPEYLLTGVETQKVPAPEDEHSVAQTEDEEDMLLLARHMEPIPEEDRKQLKEQFKKSIDLYLKARGLSETEDK